MQLFTINTKKCSIARCGNGTLGGNGLKIQIQIVNTVQIVKSFQCNKKAMSVLFKQKDVNKLVNTIQFLITGNTNITGIINITSFEIILL